MIKGHKKAVEASKRQGRLDMVESALYLPYVIPLLFGEVLVITLWLWWRRLKQCTRDRDALRGSGTSLNPALPLALGGVMFSEDGDENVLLRREGDSQEVSALFPPVPFQQVYASPLPVMQIVMLFTRFLSLSFFVGVGIGYNTVASPSDNGPDYQLKYFTNWNILLVSLYYLLAFMASVMGCCCVKKSQEETDGWSIGPRTMAVVLQIMYEVAGSTAFLVTVVDFALLDPGFYLLNVTCHFATTLSFLVESMLTNMTVRWDHYPIALWWYILYICVIWPVVLTDKVAHWPYAFLSLDSWESLLWYSGLVLGTLIFYGLWWLLNRFKQWAHSQILQSKEERLKRRNEERSVAFLDRAAPPEGWRRGRTELA